MRLMTLFVIFCVHLLALVLVAARYITFFMAETENPTPTDLKLRVLAIRGQLPANVRALIRERFPAYDTAKGAKKIENVLNAASSDQALTEFLESLTVAQAA